MVQVVLEQNIFQGRRKRAFACTTMSLRAIIQRLLPSAVNPAASNTAGSGNVARERLAIILAQQRSDGIRGINLQAMQRDILAVVMNYVKADLNDISIGGTNCIFSCLMSVRRIQENIEVLELQVQIDEQTRMAVSSRADTPVQAQIHS